MPVLWKYDAELGIAFFCPHCKIFICGGSECECEYCGGKLDWTNKVKYDGKVRWE